MIRLLINAYILLLIVDAIISYFPNLAHYSATKMIRKYAEFTLKPIRKLLPQDLPIDISVLVVIVALHLIMALW